MTEPALHGFQNSSRKNLFSLIYKVPKSATIFVIGEKAVKPSKPHPISGSWAAAGDEIDGFASQHNEGGLVTFFKGFRLV